MSEPTSEILSTKRKVFGIPLLYLVGGLVLALAIYAWRLKPATDPAPDDEDETADLPGEFLSPSLSKGTVIVAQPSAAEQGNSAIDTNEEWLKAGVAYLMSEFGIGGGEAQVALQAYLSGAQLSYAQGQLRDRVIGQYGLPPYPQTAGGTDPAPLPPNDNSTPPNEEIELLYPDGFVNHGDDHPEGWTGDDVRYGTRPIGADETWEVDPGDTLAGIAAYYGLSWQELYEANKDQLDDPSHIRVGQSLKIPART